MTLLLSRKRQRGQSPAQGLAYACVCVVLLVQLSRVFNIGPSLDCSDITRFSSSKAAAAAATVDSTAVVPCFLRVVGFISLSLIDFFSFSQRPSDSIRNASALTVGDGGSRGTEAHIFFGKVSSSPYADREVADKYAAAISTFPLFLAAHATRVRTGEQHRMTHSTAVGILQPGDPTAAPAATGSSAPVAIDSSGEEDEEDTMLTQEDQEQEEECAPQEAIQKMLEADLLGVSSSLMSTSHQWKHLRITLQNRMLNKEACAPITSPDPICRGPNSIAGSSEASYDRRTGDALKCGGSAYEMTIEKFVQDKNCLAALASSHTLAQSWLGPHKGSNDVSSGGAAMLADGTAGDPGIRAIQRGGLIEILLSQWKHGMDSGVLDNELYKLYENSYQLMAELKEAAIRGLNSFNNEQLREVLMRRRIQQVGILCGMGAGKDAQIGSSALLTDNSLVIRVKLDGADEEAVKAFIDAISAFSQFVKALLEDGGFVDRAVQIHKDFYHFRFQKLQALMQEVEPGTNVQVSNKLLNSLPLVKHKRHHKQHADGITGSGQRDADVLKDERGNSSPEPTAFLQLLLQQQRALGGSPSHEEQKERKNERVSFLQQEATMFLKQPYGLFEPQQQLQQPQVVAMGLPQSLQLPLGLQQQPTPPLPPAPASAAQQLQLTHPAPLLSQSSDQLQQQQLLQQPPQQEFQQQSPQQVQQAGFQTGTSASQQPGQQLLLPMLQQQPTQLSSSSQGVQEEQPQGKSLNTFVGQQHTQRTQQQPAQPQQIQQKLQAQEQQQQPLVETAPSLQHGEDAGGVHQQQLQQQQHSPETDRGGHDKSVPLKEKLEAVFSRLRMLRVDGKTLLFEPDEPEIDKIVRSGYLDISDRVFSIWGSLLPQASVTTSSELISLMLPIPEVDLALFYGKTLHPDGTVTEGYTGNLPVDDTQIAKRFSKLVDESYRECWRTFFARNDNLMGDAPLPLQRQQQQSGATAPMTVSNLQLNSANSASLAAQVDRLTEESQTKSFLSVDKAPSTDVKLLPKQEDPDSLKARIPKGSFGDTLALAEVHEHVQENPPAAMTVTFVESTDGLSAASLTSQFVDVAKLQTKTMKVLSSRAIGFSSTAVLLTASLSVTASLLFSATVSRLWPIFT